MELVRVEDPGAFWGSPLAPWTLWSPGKQSQAPGRQLPQGHTGHQMQRYQQQPVAGIRPQ